MSKRFSPRNEWSDKAGVYKITTLQLGGSVESRSALQRRVMDGCQAITERFHVASEAVDEPTAIPPQHFTIHAIVEPLGHGPAFHRQINDLNGGAHFDVSAVRIGPAPRQRK